MAFRTLAAAALLAPAHCLRLAPARGPLRFAVAPARARFAVMLSDVAAKDIGAMRVSELQAELDALGVKWRGVYFEKAELVDELRVARLKPPPPPPAAASPSPTPPPAAASPSPSPPPPSASTPAPPASPAVDPSSMKIKELKEELETRGVSFKGFFEKSEFVAALVKARELKVGEAKVRGSGGGGGGGGGGVSSARPVDDSDVIVGETKKMPKKGEAAAGAGVPGGMGFPGGAGVPGGMGFPGGGGMPGGMGGPTGGMPGGMGGLGDLLSGLEGMGGMGGMGGKGGMGGMGGMGDMLNKVMSNPKAMALMQKAQSNPKVMAALQDVQAKGFSQAAMAKYANDPELMALLSEFQNVMK